MRAVKVMSVVLLMIIVCSVADAATFRFTASADNRPSDALNLSRWEWVMDEITDKVGDEGVFHTVPGDHDDPQITDDSLKTHFGSGVIWYPGVGNHEAETPSDMTWVRNAYSSLPYIVNAGPTGCETTTYSFDYGNAHFISINEYYTGTTDTGADGDVVQELYDWLAADLAANTKPAVFVLGHEPAYPQFAHVGDSLDGHPTNRDRFWKLLNDEKVIAYFCGHTHYYSALQRSQTGAYPCDAFTWQVDCGNSGNPREPEQTFIDITVTDTEVTFGAWRGTEGVAFTMTETWTVEIPSVAASSPSPGDAATGVLPVGLNLGATVYNPSETTDPVDVEFFGRQKQTFSIVVLSDTQYYSLTYPAIFTAQTQWIADNAASSNIVFVTHEGDVVQNGTTAEYDNAIASMSIIDPGLLNLSDPTGFDPVVPYGLQPGNHDDITNFNSYFPYTRYEGVLSWYGGHYPSTGNENNYQLFSAGGDDYIILHIEYNPDSGVTAWANSVLAANSSRKAIITTHSYLLANGNLTSDGGTTIFNDLVVPNDNVFFVLCGHESGERTEITTVGSREVHQLLADYQSRSNGGDGWLRIMTFDPDYDEVHVQTYSPWLGQSETDADSDFVLAFDMTSSSYSSIGINLAVPSDSITTTPWAGLAMETEYEWYVTVADTMSPTIAAGPLWDFTTVFPISFMEPPTPADGATVTETSVEIEASIVEAALTDVTFNWDGTEYAIYDDSLVLMFNFDNVAALGEDYEVHPEYGVADLSGWGNHGVLSATPGIPAWIAGKYSGAFDFTGNGIDAGQSIFVAHSDSLNPGSGDFAIAVWILTRDDYDGDILRKGSTNTASTWYKIEHSTPDNNRFLLNFNADGTDALLNSTQAYNDNQWHFVVAQRNANQAELWIDGVLDGTATVTGSISNTANLAVGSKDTQDDDFINSALDEVRIYMRSFNDDEIKELYYSNLSKYESDKWVLDVNQPNLAPGTYTYQASASNAGTTNRTEQRSITIDSPQLPIVTLVSAGSDWKYFDQVDSDQGAWNSPAFDDSTWAEGPAQLGYGDGDEATAIDGSPVRASYYFRHTFNLPAAYDNLILNVVRDDGCVVYLNGVELDRSNMPAGNIDWNTWSAAVTTNESIWRGIPVDPAVTIQPGINVLAVSVHQASSTSSDVSFDLELEGVLAADPKAAGNPAPANGATNIDLQADLSWTAGIDAVSHDVYFGTNPTSPPLVSPTQAGITYDPGTLLQDTTYYWAIDEHNSVDVVTPGVVWSFTTAKARATNPDPANGATGIGINADLSWTVGADAVSHDVYFGTDSDPHTNTLVNTVSNTYDPGTLNQGVTYYWAIDERHSVDPVTVGDTWSFTTAPPSLPHTEDFESGFTLGTNVGSHSDWYDGGGGPVVTSGSGVAGSVGLGLSGTIFTWTAQPFVWTDVDKVIIGMDFQTDGAAHLDDDRLGWMISDTSTSSSNIFGVQLDPGGSGYNIEGYWDGVSSPDVRPSIVDLPALSANAWYRLRAEFTRLTDTSAGIDVEFWSLDTGGTPVALIAAGSIADTSTLGANAPHSKYFPGTNLWPGYKNHTAVAGAVDNAYFEEVPVGSAPPVISSVQTSGITGAGATITWTTDKPSDSVVRYGETTSLGSELSDAALATSHSLAVTGLSLDTLYYYEVESTDAEAGTTIDDNGGAYYSFTTPAAPGQASIPSPADAALDVSIDADLSWTAGSDTTSHDVYFGTDPDPRVNTVVNQAGTTYDPGALNPGATYYWAIDGIGPGGTTAGPIWSFTTAAAPTAATSPDPTDLTADVSISKIVSWTAGSDTTSHDVYFGTDPDPRLNTVINQAEITYDPGTLNPSITYYWAIDEVGPGGTTAGPIWSFTTAAAPGAAVNPDPANIAADVSISKILAWAAGSDATSHDVYLGLDVTAVTNADTSSPLFQGNLALASYDPGGLNSSVTYYWRVDEIGPGGITTGVVWSFTTVIDMPGQATIPNPADSASSVDINANLSWTADPGASTHDVRFGTTDPPPFVLNQSGTTYDPGTLNVDTTYFWRIDEKNMAGTTDGIVWSFTTAAAPGQAGSPNPADTATGVSAATTLNWTAGSGATSHDVYLGTDGGSLPQVSSAQSTTSYDPSGLNSDTTYYWRIDENSPGGTTTGAVWSFTTAPAPPGQATAPNPSDASVDVAYDVVLSWTAGSDTTSHNVYFGTNTDPHLNTPVNQAGVTYDPPGSLDPDTTYYWAVDEIGPGGTNPGPSWSFTTIPEPPVANDDAASSDIIVSGSIISGSYLSTGVSDNVYEAIQEVTQGRGKNAKSILEHKWTINVSGGSAVDFYVEAHHSSNSEGDDFVFAYSTDNSSYTNLLTVTKTADNDTAQTAALPGSLSGLVYIRVLDTNRSKSQTSLDSLYVDQMFIRSQTSGGPDDTAPNPDPMTWATAPYSTGSTSIAMVATTASDSSGVEYYFTCTAGGGNDSGWQNSVSYVDTGLSSGTQYTYTVTARDKSAAQNQTAASTAQSATTDSPDFTPPSPDPMTWATVPYATGSTSIAMVASTASDASGVEYYFTCTAGGGNDSGWQDSSSYTDTGLTADTQYTYAVTARDKSIAQNSTGPSSAASATTNAMGGDVVIILKAEYTAGKSELKVEATSSDGGTAVLTVVGYGTMSYDSRKNKYVLRVKPVADPGGTVTVTSSLGGSDTMAVTHK